MGEAAQVGAKVIDLSAMIHKSVGNVRGVGANLGERGLAGLAQKPCRSAKLVKTLRRVLEKEG